MQIREFNQFVASDAARVVMAFLIVEMFEVVVFLPKGGLAHDPRLQQFFEDAIDRGPGDPAPFAAALFQELFRGEMPVGVHDLSEDDPAPAGELQAALIKVIFVFFLLMNDHSETVYHQSDKKQGSFLFLPL